MGALGMGGGKGQARAQALGGAGPYCSCLLKKRKKGVELAIYTLTELAPREPSIPPPPKPPHNK